LASCVRFTSSELLKHVLELVGDQLDETRIFCRPDLHVRSAQQAMLPCESRGRRRVARGSDAPDRHGDHEAGRVSQPDQLSSKGQLSPTHLVHDGLERLLHGQHRQRLQTALDAISSLRVLGAGASSAWRDDDRNRNEAYES
jgi:hypothetical protein